MPKRGGDRDRTRGRNWNDGSNHYEHDDRAQESTRRVSFKPGTNNKIGKQRRNNKWNEALKNIDEDDIDMMGGGGGSSNNLRVNFRGGFRGRGGRREGRLNSPAPRSGPPQRKFQAGPSPWYQVTIPYGQKHDKDVILRALLSHLSPDVFIPHYYKIQGNAAIFYVDDVAMAEKLFYASKKITMSDGFRLLVVVTCGFPKVTIDSTLKEKMKLTMAKRYNPATKALDLTKFHADPDLLDIFCALFRPTLMLAAIDIIAENIPDLEALNLNDNKLHILDHLKALPNKLKKLKILYLGDNRIPFVSTLESLKGLPLVELLLQGNPLVSKFKDREIYISEVRKRFPKIIKLDGADLPPRIGFDVVDEISLPPNKASFLCNAQGQEIVRQFLEQYYAIYDSESRQQLLEAYHEKAIMSMTANYGIGQNPSVTSQRLNDYQHNSRNLLRVSDDATRKRYLKYGKLQVVSQLSDLPKTQHDLLSMAVDLTVFTPSLICLTVNGIFKELNMMVTPKPIRAFHRTMIIVPNGSGFCIKNDLLYITNATKEQEERWQRGPEVTVAPPTPVPAGLPVPVAAMPVPVAAMPVPAAGTVAMAATHVDENTKMQMLQMLSHQSGMNVHWSKNCLEETQWNYERAVFIFSELQKNNQIPPEAFVK